MVDIFNYVMNNVMNLIVIICILWLLYKGYKWWAVEKQSLSNSNVMDIHGNILGEIPTENKELKGGQK